ncbi:MAG: chemotaxis protein CheC [Myxococcota bacterium]|nr:chemotaxis protein CheC [Myxococcales bacterium]MCA9691543.1 chemotaxis protein CheC [Myxococcales bacterium]
MTRAATHDDANATRLRETARIGFENAESAFTLLADRAIEMGDVAVASPDARRPIDAAWDAGVLFELEGCLDACVALLFRAEHRDALVERMMGESPKALGPLAVEATLTEVANILASHVASGIADALGERLLPSVPMLFAEGAAGEIEAFLGERARPDAPRYSCELGEPGGELGALLVLAPTR